MKKLKIPENHSGITKTLRLPEDIVDNIQDIADKKNLSFNKVIIEFLKFGLENFEDEEEERLKDLQEVKENVRSRSAYIEKWDIAPDSQDELGKINEEQSDIIPPSQIKNDDIDNIPVANEQS